MKKRTGKINVVREADNFLRAFQNEQMKGSSGKEGNLCLFSWAIVGLKAMLERSLALNRQTVHYFLVNHQIQPGIWNTI